MSERTKHFAVCIRNDGYEESLEPRKIYEVLEDAKAAELGLVRVIDEEGEDYLYAKEWFLPIDLPEVIEQAVVELASR